MKYVILERQHGDMVQVIPVIFPNVLAHKDVAEAIAKLVGKDCKAVSAGDVNVAVHATHGKSSSLKLEGRAGDAALININDYYSMIEVSK